jgi:hypothetical protein
VITHFTSCALRKMVDGYRFTLATAVRRAALAMAT